MDWNFPQAAGVTGEDFTDINPEVAEEALEQLKTKLGLLESEVHHFRLKVRRYSSIWSFNPCSLSQNKY